MPSNNKIESHMKCTCPQHRHTFQSDIIPSMSRTGNNPPLTSTDPGHLSGNRIVIIIVSKQVGRSRIKTSNHSLVH